MNASRCARRFAVAGLLMLVVLPASTAAAQDVPRIAPTVSAAGIDLSGLTVDEAVARLNARLGAVVGRPVVVHVAGRRFALDAKTAKLSWNAHAIATAALAVTPAPVVPGGGGAAADTLIAVPIRHSRLTVKAFGAQVAAGASRAPRDASMQLGIHHQRLRRARLGFTVDQAALAAKVDAALSDASAPHALAQRVKTVYPAVNANDVLRTYGTIITVEKATFRLRLFKRLKLSRTYQVAVGQPAYPTPEGHFRIQDKQVNPVWSVPNSPWAGELGGTTVAGGTAANPLKARWMGIANGVGIHGTGEDWSIGSAASHGCIRMHVADVEDLYPRVPVGTTVIIH